MMRLQKNKVFNLIEIIFIMILTAIVSIVATGIIMLKGDGKDVTIVNKDDDLQEFVEVYNTIINKYYTKEIDKKELLKAAKEGMINYLGDRYTTYLQDDEYKEILDELGEKYEGVGIGINKNTIVSVTEGSPAEKAGILIGDKITRIDGMEVNENNSTQIKKYISDENTKVVKLEITRGNEILQFSLTKEELNNIVISSKIIDGTKTGYLSISKFSISLDKQVSEALDSLEKSGIENLIIDLTNNVGGYLTSAEKTASLFLEEGKVIYTLETSDNKNTYRDNTKEKRTYPIVVLINNNTASAAEILAAALKESYGATLIGTQSFGKGKVQEVTGLASGDSMKLTTAKWLTPNSVCIDGVGLNPDIIISDSNEQMNKALEILNGGGEFSK